MKITDIYQDQNGKIWFTTYGAGAIVLDREAWKVTLIEDGLASVAVNGVTEDPSGSLWFETYIPCCDSMDNQNIHAIFGEKNGMKSGITRYQAGNWSIFRQEFGVGDCCEINHLGATQTELWIAPCGSRGNGEVCSYDGSQVVRYVVPSLKAKFVQRILADHDNNLWFVTYQNGIIKYDRNNSWLYTEADGLIDNDVTSAVVGPDGKLWVGTRSGISGYDGSRWFSLVTTDLKSTLPSRNISDLEAGPDQVLWLATLVGVVRLDGKNWQVIDTAAGLPADDVRSIAITPDNQIWAGIVSWPPSQGDQSSVAFFNGGSWRNFENVRGPEKITITQDGTAWFLDFGGNFYEYDQERWEELSQVKPLIGKFLFSSNNQFGDLFDRRAEYPTAQDYVLFLNSQRWAEDASERVDGVAVAPDSSLWLAQPIYEKVDSQSSLLRATGVGFKKFNGEIWELQFILPDQSGLNPGGMVFSADGSLWVCPYVSGQGSDGVYRYLNGEWIHYTIQDGLSGNYVKKMYLSRDNALWFVTEGGLTRYENLNK